MTGPHQFLNVTWLVASMALVVAHCVFEHPFSNLQDAATLVGLLALSLAALLRVWRWADLYIRKVLLWIQNSSVSWTLEARLILETPLEDLDLEQLCTALRSSKKFDRVELLAGARLSLDRRHFHATLSAWQPGTEAYLIIAFRSAMIGYRDAIRVIRTEMLPTVDSIAKHVETTIGRTYSVEAQFAELSPYAAVLLNEFRAGTADQVLLVFRHEESTLSITKTSVISSSNSESQVLNALSAVFGLSIRGALSARNV